MWFCSRLGTYKWCVCIVRVKKPMAALPLICILLVCGDIMWHSGLETYCRVHRDESLRPNLFQWPFVKLPWHMEVPSNIMMALFISACAWFHTWMHACLHECHSEHVFARKAAFDLTYVWCMWVCESWRQSKVCLCTSTTCAHSTWRLFFFLIDL